MKQFGYLEWEPMGGAASYGMPSPVITGVGEGAYRRCGEFRGTLRSSWDALLPGSLGVRHASFLLIAQPGA